MTDDTLHTPFTRDAGVEVPLICGPMYPCSNPELVAAASQAGALGVLQPMSLTYVHGHDFRAGIRFIRGLTDRPIGMNALIEASSQKYLDRMRAWVDIALEEDVRFFITSLGKPDWVARRVHAVGGFVYHDATERKWGQKAVDSGVDGLIAVNSRAGGHAGPKSPRQLLDELGDLGLPLISAGGIGSPVRFAASLAMGYAGAQCGTRFIATTECSASSAYKDAIVRSNEDDIVLTERISGVPVAVINTPYIETTGTRSGPLARWMLRGHRTKHWMRAFYAMRAARQLKRASDSADTKATVWSAGKSVADINTVVPAAEVVNSFAAAARQVLAPPGIQGSSDQ